MALGSTGTPGFTVREAMQPDNTEQVLASTKLLSGIYTSPIYDTRRFDNVTIYGNISQLSGTTGITHNINYQGSVYGDNVWWSMSGSARTTTGQWYERIPSAATPGASGVINNFSRFQIYTNASNDGGIWTQVDAIFY